MTFKIISNVKKNKKPFCELLERTEMRRELPRNRSMMNGLLSTSTF